MDTLSFHNLFGNISALEMLTGFDAVAINGFTLAVVICLCLGDTLICCCGCLLCCCMWRKTRSNRSSSYKLSPIERKSTHHMPIMSRLSRISNSGIVEMEWVQNHRTSQTSDIPLHQHTDMNIYPNPHEERDPTDRGEISSTYVAMRSAKYDDDNNYDDVMNVNPHIESRNMPNMNPDRDVYDDITNVKQDLGSQSYENMRSLRMDYPNEKLI